MQTSALKPLDYLTIGHITKDLAASGFTLGGPASYSPLTAAAFGLKSGAFSSYGDDIDLSTLSGIEIYRKFSEKTTTFENIDTASGRKQYLHEIAESLSAKDIPATIKTTRILHLGPVANEVDEVIADLFPDAFTGLTPQGWMRSRSADGLVGYQDWDPSKSLIEKADAVVISVEDVQGNEDLICEYANHFRVLAVTEGFDGARVYWHGDVRRFRASKVKVIDQTGAGDIFAAASLFSSDWKQPAILGNQQHWQSTLHQYQLLGQDYWAFRAMKK